MAQSSNQSIGLMTSFVDGFDFPISSANLLHELHTDVEFSCPRKHGEELISSVWASDDSSFAWSMGTRTVFVVQTQSDDADSHARSFDLLKTKGAIRAKKTLDCTSPVTAVAFGCRSSDKKWHSDQVNYHRVQNFHKGNMVLATGLQNGDIKIWDLHSSKVILVLQDHKTAITDLSFSPDGSLILASAAKDGLVKLWDIMDDGNLFQTLTGHPKIVNSVAWSSNAQKLATVGAGRSVIIWNAQKGSLDRRLEGHQNDVTGCQFSPDGALLFTSSADTKVICWDVETGCIKASFNHMFPCPRPIFAGGVNGHEVRGVTVSQDGVHIASICNDGFLRIWNIFDSRVPVEISWIPDLRVVSFSHNSYVLAVGCRSGLMKFFASPMRITSLKRASRTTIRRFVAGSQLSKLNLPKKIRDYLNYDEIN